MVCLDNVWIEPCVDYIYFQALTFRTNYNKINVAFCLKFLIVSDDLSSYIYQSKSVMKE